jgi:hypothetical protein
MQAIPYISTHLFFVIIKNVTTSQNVKIKKIYNLNENLKYNWRVYLQNHFWQKLNFDHTAEG